MKKNRKEAHHRIEAKKARRKQRLRNRTQSDQERLNFQCVEKVAFGHDQLKVLGLPLVEESKQREIIRNLEDEA